MNKLLRFICKVLVICSIFSISSLHLYQVPYDIMRSAAEGETDSMFFNWTAQSELDKHILYLHVAELKLRSYQSRSFSLSINDDLWWPFFQYFTPSYLKTETITNTTKYISGHKSYSIEFYNPYVGIKQPIVNAVEIFAVRNFTQTETYYQDVEALSKIKTTYGIKKNWQGDPCAPRAYIWDGVNCTYDNLQHVINLNLYNSELEGPIDPAISNLSALETLDLSLNRLTGQVPDFLGQLKNLKVLNLIGNQFSGTIPRNLMAKSKAGVLTLRFDEKNRPAGTKKETNPIIIFIIIIASAGILVLVVRVASRNQKRQNEGPGLNDATSVEVNNEHVVVNKEVSNDDLAGKDAVNKEVSNKDLAGKGVKLQELMEE